MTLVSHGHEFIYIKSGRTASTSVQVALGRHCNNPRDMVTPVYAEGVSMTERLVKDGERLRRVETGILPEDAVYVPKNYTNVLNHHPPHLLKQRIPNVWNDYLKICVVRNPWDDKVSGYWHNPISKRYQDPREGFKEYLRHEKYVSNMLYYFDILTGEPAADVYLRFEHLDDDWQQLCERLGLEHRKLPRLHSQHSPNRPDVHYSWYYTPGLREKVRENYRQAIDYFGYSYEEKKKEKQEGGEEGGGGLQVEVH